MFIPTTSLLTLLFMLIATTLSAPIHIPSTGSNPAHVPQHHSLEARSTDFWGHQDRHGHLPIHKRDVLVPHPDKLASPHFKVAPRIPTKSDARGDATSDITRRSFWSKIKKAVKKVGNTVKKGIKKVGGAVKKAATAVKKGVHKVVKHVKNAAKKVVKFVKKNGLKIAKVGLKAVAAATKVASHVAGLIPGVGTSVGKALAGVSKVADFTGSKIHVSLGSKLDKVMKIMDRIQHPIGGTAGKILDTVLKRDMEGEHLSKRDLLDAGRLYERSVAELAVRALRHTSQDGTQLAASPLKYLKDI